MAGGYIKECTVVCAVSLVFVAAGMAYGWAAPVMVRLLSNESIIPMTVDQGSWVVASIEIGDMFTPIPAGIIADKFGRKPVIFSLAPLYIISWSLIILTRSLGMLVFARILLGMAMGIVFSVGPLYIGEISQPEIRGKVSTFCFVMWYVGMLISYSIGPYVSYETLSYVLIVLPIVTSFTLCFIPESPYNLLSRRKYIAAQKSLRRLRSGNSESIDNEIKEIKSALCNEHSEEKSIAELFNDPACKMSLFIFFVIVITGFFGGITVLFAYATEIFLSSENFVLDADMCTIGLGVIYLILCIIAASTVDSFGRRPLFLISAGGSGICHFIAGSYFFIQKETSINISSYSWILMLAVSGYCIFVSVGIGPMTPVYQGEIFPNEIKGIASGIFTTMMCTSSVTALKMFQVINSNLSIYVSFWVMSFVNILGFIIMYKYLVETNGKTLIEIQDEFRTLLKTSNRKINIVPTKSETIPMKNDE